MANAVRTTQNKVVVEQVEEKIVKLTLTEGEAKFLYALTSRISGDPLMSYRGMADGIHQALSRVNVYGESWTYFQNYPGKNGLHCKSKPVISA